jgi:hypothetical protein
LRGLVGRGFGFGRFDHNGKLARAFLGRQRLRCGLVPLRRNQSQWDLAPRHLMI